MRCEGWSLGFFLFCGFCLFGLELGIGFSCMILWEFGWGGGLMGLWNWDWDWELCGIWDMGFV